MRLKLKEDPREWRKFALVFALAGAVLVGLCWRAGWLADTGLQAGMALLAAALTAGSLRPRWVRPVYRGAMTASFHVGQVMGRVLLVLLFFALVTPLGWLLRLLGKDLLHLRRAPQRATYWEPARPEGTLDRLF
jgi:hypothetical protein